METVRPLRPDELDTLIDWAADEGWNPGLDDAKAFYAADSTGFLGAFVDDRLVAGLSVVAYGPQDGFLGLYICHPDYRSQGHGWRVWLAGMAYLGERRIGLDGVVDQQANYRRSGFELAYRNIRFQGAPHLPASGASGEVRPRPAEASDLDAIRTLDHHVHGLDRGAFLGAWLDPEVRSRHNVVMWDGNRLLGFGTIRQCRQHHKIGPLLVSEFELDDAQHRRAAALAMLGSLISSAGANEITLDIPEPNEHGFALAQDLGLSPVFETARMYRGGAPAISVNSIFGVTTLELG